MSMKIDINRQWKSGIFSSYYVQGNSYKIKNLCPAPVKIPFKVVFGLRVEASPGKFRIQGSPQTYWVRICILIGASGDSYAHKSLKELLYTPYHTCLYIDCEVPTGSMRTIKPLKNVVEPKRKVEEADRDLCLDSHSE